MYYLLLYSHMNYIVNKLWLVSYCDNLNHNFFKYIFYKTVALNFPQQFRILFQC